MSYLVLARKYRPQRFEDLLEQEHITRTLGNAIAAGRVAHALLFAGPRGTGKTTVARILAKALNCQAEPAAAPCNQCRSCRDIIAGHAADVFEIDGASNNSVDQIRELRENVKYMPAHSPCKIYIIDEVHMLSAAAFNALLKTLEEPPAHVMFMFATTEPHKIPITILSRCQRFDFRRVRVTTIAAYLATICRREGVDIGAPSLEMIARESGGSVRDSLSLLDQVIACGQKSIPHAQILETLGVIDRSQLHQMAAAVLAGETASFLSALDELFDRGHDIKKLFADLLEYLRDLWVIQTGADARKALDLPADDIDALQVLARQVPGATLQHALDLLYREEAAIRLAPQPKLALEMAFFRTLHTRAALSIDTLIRKVEDLRQELGGGGAGPAPS
ncbi:MAG: DNA polymerase III subunit gamma/tau, partial [Desulfobacterales bacterium]|nr:DNA polymerase III subunit gamma/tau [Desulfobacterales bacterium]